MTTSKQQVKKPKFDGSDSVTKDNRSSTPVGHIMGRYWDFDAECIVYRIEWNGTTTRRTIKESELRKVIE